MANSVQFIRKQIDIRPTPENKGLETTIKIRIYDDGMVGFNDQQFRDGRNSPMLSLARQLLQVLEELDVQAEKRRSKNKALASG